MGWIILAVLVIALWIFCSWFLYQGSKYEMIESQRFRWLWIIGGLLSFIIVAIIVYGDSWSGKETRGHET